MLDLIVVMKEYYIALAVFIAIGAAGRMVDWFSMHSLLKASRNVKETENHNLIKQMKLGYTNAYRLNYGVNNTKAFIEKYLVKNKIGKLSVSFVSSLEEKMMLMCGISCLAAVLFSVYAEKGSIQVIFVTGAGVMAVLLLRLFGTFFSSYELKQQFMIYMVDYFENVLQNRLKNHRKDNGRVSIAAENNPKDPKFKPDISVAVGSSVKGQTAAAKAVEKSPEETIVEEIIKEFFP